MALQVFLVIVLLIGLAPARTDAQAPEYVTQWETGPGNADLAIEDDGNIWVTHWLGNTYSKYTPTGEWLETRTVPTDYPHGTAYHPVGGLYVVYDGRSGGNRVLGSLLDPSSNLGAANFDGATGVAVDADGYVYVSEWKGGQIKKYSLDGAFVLVWNQDNAYDLYVSTDGFLYVIDYEGCRIEKYTTEGIHVLGWGTCGDGDGEFNDAQGITVDQTGRIYVADMANNRIQVFSSDGTFLYKWGVLGSGEGEFNWPADIAIDEVGNVYVAEYYNSRIQKFCCVAGTTVGVERTSWSDLKRLYFEK